ncbi:hypothetical protein VTI28DRAFT_4694 [Corynascus sepedonium]
MSSTASSRASGSPDHYRHKFSGSIGKKRTIKSQEPEAATPRLQLGEAYEEHTRGSVQISRALAASRILHKGNSLTRSKESNFPNIEFQETLKDTANIPTRNLPVSPGWSSKKDRLLSHSYRSSPNLRPESMLSSITQLTIPTLEFRDDQSVTEATSIIRLVQTLDREGSCVDKTVRTSHQHDNADISQPIQMGVETMITANPRAPRTPIIPRVPPTGRSRSSIEISESVSRFMDVCSPDSRKPTRPPIKSNPDGKAQSDKNLLLLSAARRASETQIQQSTERRIGPPRSFSSIRLSTENPSNWRAIGQ